MPFRLYIVSSNENLLQFLMNNTLFPPSTIDYWSADDRFPVLARCVTPASPDSLFSSETVLILEMKLKKKTFSDWAQFQKAIGGIHFTKKWRIDALQ
jgi:hypothetical protein